MRRRLTLVVAAAAGFVLAAVAAPPADARPQASCYGPGLWGNRMANGRVLYPSTVAVAHKTLRLGTLIGVRSGGMTVRAKVQDRGPFVANRHLDLTEAAVRRLGYPSCTAFGHRPVLSWIIRR